MKAVVIREHGDLDALQFVDVDEPVPAPDEVLVDVRAIGLNHLDTWVRRGVPGHTFPLPIVPGCDFAGEIVGLGSAVRGLTVGQRVLAAPGTSCGLCPACQDGDDHLCPRYGVLGEASDGGCRERATLPAVNALPIPDALDFVTAAAFPLTFLTAWQMLVRRCALREGETLLVHAAGAGVSTAAIQIAKLRGARVIATTGSPEKVERALALGADEVVDTTRDDFVRRARAFAGRKGIDVVFEHVGEATFPGSLRCLGRGGRVVTCGATTGPVLTADLRHVFFKNLSILGSTMGRRGDLVRLVDLVARGLLRPVIDRVLPLEAVREAHALLAERSVFGKIVLQPGASS
ncbi:MAG: zinc-binding dehydrogenase [Planctomycetes bacterium]|nr:zinc-binding dehydrogenase [Planctomycetota bacterium]MCB9916704.1 zinc-binding dehydrogenase [Planctomycetota bacterium]